MLCSLPGPLSKIARVRACGIRLVAKKDDCMGLGEGCIMTNFTLYLYADHIDDNDSLSETASVVVIKM